MPSAAASSSARASPWRLSTSRSARRVTGSVSRVAVSSTDPAYGFQQRSLRKPSLRPGAAEAAAAACRVRQDVDGGEVDTLDALDHELRDAIPTAHGVRLARIG